MPVAGAWLAGDALVRVEIGGYVLGPAHARCPVHAGGSIHVVGGVVLPEAGLPVWVGIGARRHGWWAGEIWRECNTWCRRPGALPALRTGVLLHELRIGVPVSCRLSHKCLT